MRRLAAALAIAAGPALADASAFEGDWAVGDPAACVSAERGDRANLHLIIRDGMLIGLENRCRLTDPVAVEGMSAVLFDSECQAEGEDHRERLLLMLDHEGRLVMLRDGFVWTYPRCTGYADR